MKIQAEEKRVVKLGLGYLDKMMNYKQALLYGNKNMPIDLKRYGFKVTIFISNLEIDGAKFYRINYAK